MRKLFPVSCLLAAFVLCQPAPGSCADETALTKLPARNAALLPKVPGFKSADEKLYLGDRKVTEGVMVRQSQIRDGKLIIPPAGLVYSSRVNNIGTMTGLDLMLLGKLTPEVDEEAEMLVIKDRHMKVGESVNLLPDGSRTLHFVSGSSRPYGIAGGDSANFRIMKSTGNYYGTNFVVAGGEPLQDVNSGEFKGYGLPEGSHSLDANAPEALQHGTYVGNSIYPSGNSYIIADNITAKEADVKEFATPMLKRVWLAADPRIRGEYAVGETVKVGDATVSIDEIGPDNVTLTLTDAAGAAQTKKFEGLKEKDAVRYIPAAAADRARFQMGTADDKVRVQLGVLHPEGALTADGKVRLDMFSGVYSFGNPEPWPNDPRFNVRPDT